MSDDTPEIIEGLENENEHLGNLIHQIRAELLAVRDGGFSKEKGLDLIMETMVDEMPKESTDAES
jgi:hypothetical protein